MAISDDEAAVLAKLIMKEDVKGMNIDRYVGGLIRSNGYVIYHNEGGQCYIIDPGYKAKRFIDDVRSKKLIPKGIIFTHHHYDHTGAADEVEKELGCPAFMYEKDLEMYEGKAQALTCNQELDFEGEIIKIINTPGHTAGSICLVSDESKLAFTGDTIFNVDLGRTDLEDGNMMDMEKSVMYIDENWSDDMMIYPGHGDPCDMVYVRKKNREYLNIVKKHHMG